MILEWNNSNKFNFILIVKKAYRRFVEPLKAQYFSTRGINVFVLTFYIPYYIHIFYILKVKFSLQIVFLMYVAVRMSVRLITYYYGYWILIYYSLITMVTEYSNLKRVRLHYPSIFWICKISRLLKNLYNYFIDTFILVLKIYKKKDCSNVCNIDLQPGNYILNWQNSPLEQGMGYIFHLTNLWKD